MYCRKFELIPIKLVYFILLNNELLVIDHVTNETNGVDLYWRVLTGPVNRPILVTVNISSCTVFK